MEIEPSADSEQIKTAYRRLAKRYHPDINPSPSAKARMQGINRAYEVLGDPIKRARYDRWGRLPSGYRHSYTSTRASYSARYQRPRPSPRGERGQSPPPRNPWGQRPPPYCDAQRQSPPRPRTAQRRSPFGQARGAQTGCAPWLVWLLIPAIINGFSNWIPRSKPNTNFSSRSVESTRVSAQATATAQKSLSIAQVSSQWPLVVIDSFDENLNNWPVGELSDEWWTGNGSLTDGKYRWEANAHRGFIHWFYPDHKSVKDFYLTVQGQRLKGPIYTEIGVIFRYLGGNYYVFSIDADQRFRFLLHFDDEWTTLIPSTWVPVIKRDEEDKLTVIAEGSHFLFFINDQFVGEAENTKLKIGRTGVVIIVFDDGDEAVFEFDDFELRRPDDPGDDPHHPSVTPVGTHTPTPEFSPTTTARPPHFLEPKCHKDGFCG